jgi:hypothetical protein
MLFYNFSSAIIGGNSLITIFLLNEAAMRANEENNITKNDEKNTAK